MRFSCIDLDSYLVKEKTENVLNDIARLIRSKYTGESGIVYCLTKKDAEQVAEELSVSDRTLFYTITN